MTYRPGQLVKITFAGKEPDIIGRITNWNVSKTSLRVIRESEYQSPISWQDSCWWFNPNGSHELKTLHLMPLLSIISDLGENNANKL